MTKQELVGNQGCLNNYSQNTNVIYLLQGKTLVNTLTGKILNIDETLIINK